MSLVVDASTALKWVLEEDGSDRARDLVTGAEPLLAPDFLSLECANVLAVMVRRGMLAPAEAREKLAALETMPMPRFPAHPHVSAAQRLAIELGRSAYDCLYLALALAENAVMVTADRRFAEAVAREPAYAPAIRLL